MKEIFPIRPKRATLVIGAMILLSSLCASSIAAAKDSESVMLATDPQGDAVPGADLTYMSLGPSGEGLDLVFGFADPLTPTDILLDGSLSWTFSAKSGRKPLTYYTVGAEFRAGEAPAAEMLRWDRCTWCADWGADKIYNLESSYGSDGELIIALPSFLARSGTKIRTCEKHRTYCNYSWEGEHVLLHAHLPVTTKDLDVMTVDRTYRAP